MVSTANKNIDLNCDLGEGFGPYRIADDATLLRSVTSASVACGFHAGDPDLMAATFSAARAGGVRVGAHPGFPDLWGFGRRRLPCTADEIERLVAYQIGAAAAMAAYAGHRLTHVKPHGALGNLTETDRDVAAAVTRATRAVDPNLVCLVIANSEQRRIAEAMGMATRVEICADRAYGDDGRLLSRALPGAVIHDPERAAGRAVRMVERQALETVSGNWIATPIDSVCVHSDTEAAPRILSAVRSALELAGFTLKAFAS